VRAPQDDGSEACTKETLALLDAQERETLMVLLNEIALERDQLKQTISFGILSMRVLSLLTAGLVVIAGCGVASAAQPYEGFWASTKKDCTDQDSANRMSIEGGNRLYWYETRCRAGEIKPDGERAWKMRMSCEGEGMKYKSSPRVSVAADGRLVIDNGPVGENKRLTYVRCAIPKKH
jgi:hypothetical protein